MKEQHDQLIDIYDVWYEPFYRKAWFYWSIRIGIALLCVSIVWYLYKKYKERSKKVDCSLVAYQDLENLKKIHIATQKDSKDCYFKLSSIIKQYLACRYSKIFEKLTDKEVVRHAALYVSDADIRVLQQLFQGMLFIKFEHEVAAIEKLEKDIQLVKEFIENTSYLEETKER